MAEYVDDIHLPNTAVTRVAKEVLPENVSIRKDATIALEKAASVFVLYVTSAANALSKKNKRKKINGNDIIEAMHKTNFHMFADQLKENHRYFKKIQRQKKKAAVKQKLQKEDESSCSATTDNVDEVDTD